MASNGTIAHRFANKDYNFERGLKGSSTHIDGREYYSYSTVFGQWVDEKVCVVYLGSTSVTSCKHQLGRYCFPKDVVVLPYDDGGSSSYYGGGWHGCKLLGWGEDFKLYHRWKLMDYWMSEIYAALETIKGGKKKDLDGHAAYIIGEYWPYMEKLCSLYKDTTIPKYIKRCDKKYKKLVKALKDGEREVNTLVDLVFGEGTWQAYYDYCGRYRKAEDNKGKILSLCNRLGIASPYQNKFWSENWKADGYTADQIRKLTAKQRNAIHFASLMRKEWYDAEQERKDKYHKNSDNAYLWIVGYTPKMDNTWTHEYSHSTACRNMFTGQEYNLPEGRVFGFYWCDTNVKFEYDKFRKAEDKEQWIRDFYAKCQRVQDNTQAIFTLSRISAHYKEKTQSHYDTQYIDDDYLREHTTDEEYAVCSDFIKRQDKYFADKEAQRRAAEIARLKREEEERKEKELQERIKREQINECLERGVEGCRDIWRKHYTGIADAKQYAFDIESSVPFFFGGNVLMRFSINKDVIETSKSIRITIPACKAMWKLVSKWHNNPESFKPMTIKTLSGTYTISSYEDDILTAGCHDIAYAEMERMYNEIVKFENEAA